MSADSPDTPRPLGEISQEPSSFEQFLDRNQRNLAILAFLLVIAAAAYIIYRGLQKSHEHSAGAALSQANDLPALQKIIKDHPKTAAGGSSRVLAAETLWNEGQQDDAISSLRSFIDELPDHPAIPTAQASLGSKLAAQGKAGEAAKAFEELTRGDQARFLAPYALVALGDLAKNAGDTEKARGFYERAQNEFPESNFATTATTRIGLLNAKPPVEIEPPPAPEGEAAPAGADASDVPPFNLIPAPGLPAEAPPTAPAPSEPASTPAPAESSPAPSEPSPAESAPAEQPVPNP